MGQQRAKMPKGQSLLPQRGKTGGGKETVVYYLWGNKGQRCPKGKVCCPKGAKKLCPLGNNRRGATKALWANRRGAKGTQVVVRCPEGKSFPSVLPLWATSFPSGSFPRGELCSFVPKGIKT